MYDHVLCPFTAASGRLTCLRRTILTLAFDESGQTSRARRRAKVLQHAAGRLLGIHAIGPDNRQQVQSPVSRGLRRAPRNLEKNSVIPAPRGPRSVMRARAASSSKASGWTKMTALSLAM
jgi:hypothetical protein